MKISMKVLGVLRQANLDADYPEPEAVEGGDRRMYGGRRRSEEEHAQRGMPTNNWINVFGN